MALPLIVGAAVSAGLPIALEALQRALSGSDNPTAKAAGEAAGQLVEAIDRGVVPPEEVKRVEADLVRMFEAETARQAVVNETMRVESGAEDAFVRRWRPFFGYSVAIAWFIQSMAIAATMLLDPSKAATLIVAFGEGTATHWMVALSVLGIGIWSRSQDKRAGAGIAAAPGAVGAIGRLADALRR